MILRVVELPSPLGRLKLVTSETHLLGLSFPGGWSGLHRFIEGRFGKISLSPVPRGGEIANRVASYFEGELRALDAIPVDPGGSPFQQRVWKQLRRIEVGRTASYSDVARQVGHPKAFRAVATSNARNPIAVVIPCHRVIHADGSISGYGRGVDHKRWLLRHEGALLL